MPAPAAAASAEGFHGRAARFTPDQCTREMAAAPIGGQQQSMAAPQPGETEPMPPK